MSFAAMTVGGLASRRRDGVQFWPAWRLYTGTATQAMLDDPWLTIEPNPEATATVDGHDDVYTRDRRTLLLGTPVSGRYSGWPPPSA